MIKLFSTRQPFYKKAISLLFFSLVSVSIYGQVVSGTVVDNLNQTIPGANVMLKGTNIGTSTDLSGNFSLDISKAKEKTLVGSYIGFMSKEVAIGNQEFISITLVEDVQVLDEVVLIGYGSKKKKDLTGSVASVSAKDFQKVPVTNAEDLIANKLPGVQITPSSGKPGAGSSILIRGGSSLSATNNPLIVIDGVPMEGFGNGPGILSQLNPNDIESFTVLKDASAAAIYGSRASNGVIIITTKKGSTEKFEVNVSSNTRFSEIIRRANVLSANQYREVVNEIGGSRTPMGTANTDWQNEIYQQAITQEYNVGMSGQLAKKKGHLIANDSWNHENGYTFSNQLLWETQVNKTLLESANFGIKNCNFYRPPFGAITQSQIDFLASKNIKTLLWSISTEDWNPKENKEGQMFQLFKKQIHPGAIVLFHDYDYGNLDAKLKDLEDILKYGKSQGYQFVTIAKLHL